MFNKIKKFLLADNKCNAKCLSLTSFSELLKFFKVNNGKFLYFNNKICYIKIFCLMTSHECLLIFYKCLI